MWQEKDFVLLLKSSDFSDFLRFFTSDDFTYSQLVGDPRFPRGLSEMWQEEESALLEKSSDFLDIPRYRQDDFRHVQVTSAEAMTAIQKQTKGPDVKKKVQTKNRNVTQAIRSMTAEYFRPATNRPSPIWPATRPEKNACSIAAWAKSRL